MNVTEKLSRSALLIIGFLVANTPLSEAWAAGDRTAISSIRQSFRLGVWTSPVQYFDPITERVTTGLRINGVQFGGPAQSVGVETGDIIVSIDGKRVETVEDLSNTLDNSGGIASIYLRDWRTGRYVSREGVSLTKVFVVSRTESNTTETVITP